MRKLVIDFIVFLSLAIITGMCLIYVPSSPFAIYDKIDPPIDTMTVDTVYISPFDIVVSVLPDSTVLHIYATVLTSVPISDSIDSELRTKIRNIIKQMDMVEIKKTEKN